MISVDEKLGRVASKAEEWRALDAKTKLGYLEGIAKNFSKSYHMVQETSDLYQTELRKVEGEEFEFYTGLEALVQVAPAQNILQAFIDSYKVLVGTKDQEKDLKELKTRISGNGQIVAQIFPLTKHDKGGPQAKSVGEVMFDADKVKSVDDVKPFQLEQTQSKEPGLCVILAAGNYPMLAFADAMYHLFNKNQVVFIKCHQIRGGFDKLVRFLFKELYENGYMDSELHISMERASALLYSRHTSSVHLTGGKHSHDMIVWGTTEEERNRRMRADDPKLKATMTSELGAVTPFIVTPAKYTEKELDHQAETLASAKWIFGGASCNAPQVVIVSGRWQQRDEFRELIKKHWTNMYAPVAYYPGSQERVNAFVSRYSDKAIRWMGKLDKGSNSMHMPLLVIDIDVDMTTEAGRKAAKGEYALRNEAFAPVLVFATLKTKQEDEDPASFLNDAVALSNDALFGSLSCALMVPDQLQKERYIEKSIEDLKYGGITLNGWPGLSHTCIFGSWGAFPGENLDNVESGIGHVHNALFLPYIEKTVMWRPIISEQGNILLNKPRKEMIRLHQAVVPFLLQPGLATLLPLLRAIIGPAVYIVPALGAALFAAAIGFFLRL